MSLCDLLSWSCIHTHYIYEVGEKEISRFSRKPINKIINLTPKQSEQEAPQKESHKKEVRLIRCARAHGVENSKT